MADSEKGESSTGKAKGKTSMLDDDISKDFLGSWKSMSMAGGDDMDFNFEPITKGNKKPFDFGKLDMDFSLDGEFEKMSSFKIDMPDLDFSNSPKKSTKSKKTSEVESGKGRNCSKNNDFTFSFEFNGMDDFSLDTPSTKGGKSPSREKSSKEVGFSKEIECEDLPKQVDDDDGKAAEDTTGKTPPISENASNSISEDLMDSKRNFDASFANCSSKSAIEVDMSKPEGIINSSEKNLTGDVQETDQHHHLADRTAFDDSGVWGAEKDVHPIPESGPSKSTSLTAAVELVDTNKSSNTEKMLTVEGTDEEEQTEKGISKQSYTKQKVKDLSANSLLGKMPSQSTISEEMEVSSLHDKQNDRSELSTLNGQLSAATGEKLKPDKSSSECLTDKMNVGYGENKTLVVGSISTSKLTCHSMDPSATNASEALPCETRSKAETQRSALKVFSSPFGSGSTLAKPTVMAYKVPGSYNSKFPRVDNTKQGVRANLSIMERKNKCSTHSSAAGDRNKDNGMKIDSNPNSCTKEVVKQDSVAKSTEKNADVDTLSSRDSDNNMKQKTQSELGIDTVLHGHDRQAKDEHFVLGSEKKIEDVKSFSLDAPLCAPSQQECKFSKQMSSKFKDKIPSIVPIQKSNVSQMNKFPSLTVGKKLSGFPISRSSMNAAINKHLASPAVGEDAKSTGTFENKLLAKSKTGPPVGSEKQRPSPSLKRKPSEAADEGPKNPHPLKRLSPSESRMSEGMSPGKAMEEVYTKGSLSEGRAKNVAVDHPTSKFDFYPATSMEDLGFTVVLESDANVEKAEACAKELEDICNMLKKKHEEAKELLVRALVNNNNLLMLNHPIYEEKISFCLFSSSTIYHLCYKLCQCHRYLHEAMLLGLFILPQVSVSDTRHSDMGTTLKTSFLD